MLIKDLCELPIPSRCSAVSRGARLRPPQRVPPTVKKCRRDNPSQKAPRPEDLLRSVNIGFPVVGVSSWANRYTLVSLRISTDIYRRGVGSRFTSRLIMGVRHKFFSKIPHKIAPISMETDSPRSKINIPALNLFLNRCLVHQAVRCSIV